MGKARRIRTQKRTKLIADIEKISSLLDRGPPLPALSAKPPKPPQSLPDYESVEAMLQSADRLTGHCHGTVRCNGESYSLRLKLGRPAWLSDELGSTPTLMVQSIAWEETESNFEEHPKLNAEPLWAELLEAARARNRILYVQSLSARQLQASLKRRGFKQVNAVHGDANLYKA